jgi:RNA polymerase sigma-54 factor
MRFMLKLDIQLRQQLSITPQLRQAIQLLQLPAVALESEINKRLEENVMLERIDDGDGQQDSFAGVGEAHEAGAAPDDGGNDWAEASCRPASGAERTSAHRDGLEPQQAVAETLRDHLLWQLEMSAFAPADLAVGVALIDNLDEDGYLLDDLEEIRQALAPDLSVSVDRIKSVLGLIQRFDPVGVAARDLPECLRVQLDEMPASPARALTRRLIDSHLDEAAYLSGGQLAKRLNVAEPELRAALALLRSLEPHPGRGIGAMAAEPVVPDVIVTHAFQGWRVEPNDAALGSVGVQNKYAGLLNRLDKTPGHETLKMQLQEARWFVRSLAMRRQTVLKVARSIVAEQAEFLERGEAYLKPLILRDIAERIEMHESTVSRVVANKFMQTPRGTFEFKAFFSQAVRADETPHAVQAIKARLKKLILTESPAIPLSDSGLRKALAGEGIEVARRTVARYRDDLGFPTWQRRKRAAELAMAS